MATQSTNPTQDKLQNPGDPEAVQPTKDNEQDAQATGARESPTPSVFVNSEPMREEQVQNAVKFLSHPRVRGSPVIYRRSFLEKKGLTKEEIDEAFRRVPDPPPTVASGQAATTNHDGQLKSSSDTQTPAQTQSLQPAVPASIVPKRGMLIPFRWSHALIAIGLLATSGAGTLVVFKKAIVPRLKSWIRKVVFEDEDDPARKANSKPSLAEEAAAAAKAAAAAAADVTKASQEMINSKYAERKYFDQFTNLLDLQVQEMKSMSNALRKIEGQYKTSVGAIVEEDNRRGSIADGKHSYANGNVNGSVKSSSPPGPADTSAPPHPKSFMEIMEMVQRGEKPPNIKEINDLPPNPNQQPSNPRLAPRAKPWEHSLAMNSSNQDYQPPYFTNGLNPNVQADGINSQLNGNNSSATTWRQQKSVKVPEIETEDGLGTSSYGISNERQPQRKWLPPQPPPVAMPEAAAAIRQPKSSLRKEQTDDGELSVHSEDGVDELQSITKLSELGGVIEDNGGTSGLNSSEIQAEQEVN